MIDVGLTIRNALLAQAALTAVVGNRIWGESDVPPVGYTPSTGGAIVFKVRGGQLAYSGGIASPSVQFKCYGIDEPSAKAVYRALVDVLNNKAIGGIRSAFLEQLGQVAEDQDTGWVFCLVFFTIWTAI